MSQNKPEEAESLLVNGYEGMSTHKATLSPQAASQIPKALDQLIELYEALEKPDDVAKYRKLREGYPNDTSDADK